MASSTHLDTPLASDANAPHVVPSKAVYFFGGGSAEGTRDMKAALGGKGANLAEMTNLGVPVPPVELDLSVMAPSSIEPTSR